MTRKPAARRRARARRHIHCTTCHREHPRGDLPPHSEAPAAGRGTTNEECTMRTLVILATAAAAAVASLAPSAGAQDYGAPPPSTSQSPAMTPPADVTTTTSVQASTP